jgi:hypothetical protein
MGLGLAVAGRFPRRAPRGPLDGQDLELIALVGNATGSEASDSDFGLWKCGG